MAATKEVPLKDIVIDGGTQQRPVDDDTMKRYKALIKEGFEFPSVSIITDGNNKYLWDGYHRYFAHLKLGKKYISATVEKGTRRDAIFFSFAANKTNAFPRQPGTAKGIIEKILKDEEWATMSARGIADHVGCTERYVFKIQADLKKQDTSGENRGMNSSYLKPDSKPNNQLSRAKTRTVRRGDGECEVTVPEKKVLDATGKQVPKHLIKYFERANEYRAMIKQLNDQLRTVREGKEKGDLFYRYIKIENLTAQIGNVKRIFKFAMPFAVCGYCQADENNAECRACDGCGWVNEITFKATPKEFK